ncbi:MAG: aldehyde ferredoxin oxidoreductase family protein [Candidatus Bathyarchaeia archaeon]
MTFGYCGKVLRVDLSDGKISVDEPPERFYRQYFGGEALIAYYLLREVKPSADPLGPENLLIFASGVMTGHPFTGSGRNSVGGKSPLTNGFGCSEVGGYWGSELKRSGFDAIVISGRAENPSYLWVHDGEVEIRDAEHLWGLVTGRADELLRSELGRNIRTALIGPAGEKGVRYACIANDLTHFAGRTGMGAVMGSKNLKAVVVRGAHAPEMADAETVRELARWVSDNPDLELPIGRTLKSLRETGTGGGLLSLNASSGLPTRNFAEGEFEGAEEISGERMVETILTGRHTCYGCVINCKRTVKVDEPYLVDPVYGGPEYETLAALGSNCGVKDLKAIAKANEICNAYGLDTISTGVCVAFAMECYMKGLIGLEDAGGFSLKFGDAEAMVETVRMIGERRGLGQMLGEGVRRAAEKIGGNAYEYAMHVKGLEIPMHEPRLKKGLGVGYAVSPTGADHCHNLHDTLFQGWGESMKAIQALGVLEPMPANSLDPEKVRLLVYASNWRHFTNSAVICYFTPWFYDNTPRLVNAITGWNTTTWELMKIGERAATLARVFNVREGFTAEDDRLPGRFAQPFSRGPIAGERITGDELEKCKKIYYRMMGWDDEGVPTAEKLYELDVGWAVQHLPHTER